jgi:hypothetical protein
MVFMLKGKMFHIKAVTQFLKKDVAFCVVGYWRSINNKPERERGHAMDGGTDRRAARAQCSGSHVVFTLDREIVRRCCKSSHISLDAPGGRAAGATWVAACHIRLVTQPQGVIVHMTRGFPLSSVIRVRRYVDSTSLEEISLLGR